VTSVESKISVVKLKFEHSKPVGVLQWFVVVWLHCLLLLFCNVVVSREPEEHLKSGWY